MWLFYTSLKLLEFAWFRDCDWTTRLEGHEGPITSVAFSLDGRYAVTGSEDGTVMMWDTASGIPLRRYPHGSPVIAVRYATDEAAIIAASADGSLIVWDGSLYSNGVMNWVSEKLYVPSLTCEQRILYNAEPLCDIQ
ncbi:MAG: hypothetical protein K8L99_01210 [Anaerolineae bacterium]|nr:hypothetical protein [Anaerolineae bacterium]